MNTPHFTPARAHRLLTVLVASFVLGAVLGSATAWLLVARVAQAQEATDG